MSDTNQGHPGSQTRETKSRPVGGTEFSWCKAVPGGTGITVLALLVSKFPDIPLIQAALHQLQTSHPILRSKLHYDAATATFSFVTPPFPHIQIQLFDHSSTVGILSDNSNNNPSVTPFHLILEHEINKNPWSISQTTDQDIFFASVYTLSESQWVVVLRLHTGACDRASAVVVLRELLKLVSGRKENSDLELYNGNGRIGLGIEDCIPKEKSNKPFWARGIDVLGYSLNSFRLANLNFVDASSARCSQVLRLQMNPDETDRLLQVICVTSLLFRRNLAMACNSSFVNYLCVFEGLQIERDSTLCSHNSCWFDCSTFL